MSAILLQAAAKRGMPVPPPPHGLPALAELAASLFLRPLRSGRRVPREEAYLSRARRFVIPTRRGDLAAWEWGEPAAPLVGLVHGWEGHGAQLGAFAAPLAEAGFRVASFDLPGHGESPGDEAHVPLVMRLLPEIESRIGRFHALIGHSMGAAGAAMATQHGLAPRGLVLLAPPMSMRERVERVARRMQLDPELREAFLSAAARRTGTTLEDIDMNRVAERAPCALLVFHDPEDTDTSYAEAEKIVAAWRGARLVPCPGRGHHRILATPEIVRQAVGFIASLR
ncbi:MAG: hypothetical protein C0502_04530 [Opitutus sp.]|nr:hypothetical protein [Opitutus sp.]